MCVLLSLAACKTTPDLLLDEAAFTSATTRRFPGETRERIVRGRGGRAPAVGPEPPDHHADGRASPPSGSSNPTASSWPRAAATSGPSPPATSRTAAEAVVRLAPRGGGGPAGPAISITRGRNPAPLYDLFWSRVEYVLGRRAGLDDLPSGRGGLRGSGQGRPRRRPLRRPAMAARRLPPSWKRARPRQGDAKLTRSTLR